jgi:PPM family protein phosphatase
MPRMADVQGLYLVTAIVLVGLVLWVVWVLWRAPVATLEAAPTVQAKGADTSTSGVASPEDTGSAHEGSAPDVDVTDDSADVESETGEGGGRTTTILGVTAPARSTPSVEVLPPVGMPPKEGRLDSHLEIQDSPAVATVIVMPDGDAHGAQESFVRLAAAVGRGGPTDRSPETHVIDSHRRLFLIADGSGKRVGPTLASAIAVDQLLEAFETEAVSASTSEPKLSLDANRLRRAVLAANRSLLQKARASGYAGLGTSIFAAHFSSPRREVSVAHVGTHRAYRLRNGELTRLTTPHGGRLLGVSEKVEVEVATDVALQADLYLFCSEGLVRARGDDELLAVLKSEQSLERMTERLVDGAKTSDVDPSDVSDLVAMVVRVERAGPVSEKSSGLAKTVMGLG